MFAGQVPALRRSHVGYSGVGARASLGRFRTVTDKLPQSEGRERLARRALLRLEPDQDATFEELMAAAEWTRANPGPFVDTEAAAEILGVSVQYVGRLTGQGRLP
jgi:hypothetical protein